MKKVMKYLLAAMGAALMLVSCQPDDPADSINPAHLIGKWQLMVDNGKDVSADLDYWKFDSDGTGSVWVESIGGTEGEQLFDWTLTDDNLVMIHYVGGTPEAPWAYTVDLLNASNMKLKDKTKLLEFEKK